MPAEGHGGVMHVALPACNIGDALASSTRPPFANLQKMPSSCSVTPEISTVEPPSTGLDDTETVVPFEKPSSICSKWCVERASTRDEHVKSKLSPRPDEVDVPLSSAQ